MTACLQDGKVLEDGRIKTTKGDIFREQTREMSAYTVDAALDAYLWRCRRLFLNTAAQVYTNICFLFTDQMNNDRVGSGKD